MGDWPSDQIKFLYKMQMASSICRHAFSDVNENMVGPQKYKSYL